MVDVNNRQSTALTHTDALKRMSASLSSPLTAPVSQSSNLLQYRALFQLFSYARAKRQSAEHLVRDAMTGGVVVPFCLVTSADTLPSDAAAATTAPTIPRVSPTPTLLTGEQPLPLDEGQGRSAATDDRVPPLLLLPSSKCIATLASLVADGFFQLTPLASTAERVREAPSAFRSECEPRDFFTLLALLYPDCCVPDDVPRAVAALRRTNTTSSAAAAAAHTGSTGASSERTTPATLRASSPPSSMQASTTASRGWRSPVAHDSRPVLVANVDGTLGAAAGPLRLTPLPPPDAPADSFAASRSAFVSASPQLLSPMQPALAEFPPDASQVANASVAAATTSVATTGASGLLLLPEVDPVPLTLDDANVLLECRRSLATVLLSSLNEALHDVQYRELERGRPAVTSTKERRSSEAVALHATSEVLLTVKAMLMTLMAAAEVWWRRWRQQSDGAQQKTEVSLPSFSSSPHAVLCELLAKDAGAAARFTTLAVEDWTWGRDGTAMAQWYDQTLQSLLQSSEAAGLKLDAFLQTAKSFAAQQGSSVSRAPTLVLHRPSDGHPAVQLNLSFVSSLNGAIALPVMPVQTGELQLLLHPCVVRPRGSDSVVVVSSRGHEMLFDATASPTAEFLQSCAATACPAATLQSSGAALPALLRHRFGCLSASERGAVRAFLSDRQSLSAVLDKNAAMLARLTLWAEGLWPPAISAYRGDAATSGLATTEDGYELAASIKESVLFSRPFNASVGRYLREVLLLNGFDQMTLERWIRKVCEDLAGDTGFVKHRTTLSALVKFAALQSKWTWTSEISDLQKLYLS